MRRLAIAAMLAWLAIITPLTSGCGPSVSRDEMGQVIYDLPAVPDKDRYQLPDLKTAGDSDDNAEQGHIHAGHAHP